MANSSGGSGGKNPLAALGSAKAKGIIALVLVGVLLVASIVGSIASFIGMLIGSEDEEQNQDYQETYLFVRATDKETGEPISNMNIHLEQILENKDSDGNSNKKTHETPLLGIKYKKNDFDPQTYDLGPTDKDGIASTLYNVAGMISGFNYPCPAQFKPDAKGRPTVYYKVLKQGNTFYSQTDGPSQDKHHNRYKGNMGIAKLNPTAAKKDHYKNGQPDATDTWHIVARLNATSWIPYNTYCYIANDKGYDWGSGIVEDNGGGAKGADVDCYAPYTKYFSPYIDDSSIAGHSSTDTLNCMHKWLKACGVPTNIDFFHGHGTVYLMGSNSSESQKAGKAIWNQINKAESQPWPGTTAAVPGSPGTTVKDSGSSEKASDIGEVYKITAKTSGKDAKYKADTGLRKIDMAKVRGATSQDTGIVVVCGISPKFNLTFWMETRSSSDGVDLSGINVHAPQYITVSAGGKNTCHADGTPIFSGSALPNCASWVWGRYYDFHGKGPGRVFKGGAKLTSLSQLHSGDYIQWGGNGDHVAFVEQVSSSGVLISESGKTYCRLNKQKHKPHPYYQTGTYTSIDALLKHSHGRPMQVVH